MTCLEELFFLVQVSGGVWFVRRFSTGSVLSKVICYLIGHLTTLFLFLVFSKLLDVRYWFLSAFPSCGHGQCHRKSDYIYLKSDPEGGAYYRCKCGDVYLMLPTSIYRIESDGRKTLVAQATGRFFLRWKQVGEQERACR